jgi:hypothetical protein
MTLQQIAEALLAQARRCYDGGMSQVLPLCHAETANGDVHVIGLPWEGPDGKSLMLDTLRDQFEKTGIVRYGIMSEAWLAMYHPGSAPYPEVPPSKREDRVEVISIGAADQDGNRLHVAHRIERDTSGHPSVGEVFAIPGCTTAGRMITLLEGV